MNRVAMVLLGCLLLGTVGRGAPAIADVSILWTGGQLFVDENQIDAGGERRITIRCVPVADMSVTIRATSGSNPIRYINVACRRNDAGFGKTLLAVLENGGTVPYIRQIAKIDYPNADDGEVWIHTVEISGTIGGPGVPHSGVFIADIVSQLRSTSGDINADIVAGPRQFGGASTIVHLRAPAGDITGDIFAWHGEVREITAGGDIGSTTNSVAIEAKQGVWVIEADAVYADIGTSANGGNEYLRFLEARTGSFVGSLYTRGILSPTTPAGLDVAGDIDADIVVTESVEEPVLAGELSAGRTISIGSHLDTSADITLASGGLKGQIIINAAAFTGEWRSDVTVDTTALDPVPYYSNLSASLGGGAVGHVPFYFHAADCVPAHNAVVTYSAYNPPTQVAIRHYGPVTFSGTMPYVIKAKANPNPGAADPDCTGTDVSSNFTATLSGGNPREVIVTPNSGYSFSPAHDYCFTAVTDPEASNRLRCADVPGNPPAHDYTYAITFTAGVFDLTGEGEIDMADAAAWVAEPVDFTGDEAADGVDFGMLMNEILYGGE